MGIAEKIMEAMKTTVLLNERVVSLTEKVTRVDDEQRKMNERLVRVETFFEIAKARGISDDNKQISE